MESGSIACLKNPYLLYWLSEVKKIKGYNSFTIKELPKHLRIGPELAQLRERGYIKSVGKTSHKGTHVNIWRIVS